MLRDIVFHTHLDVFRRVLLGNPPACVEPMTVQLQPGERAVWAKLRASPIVHIPGDEKCWGDLLPRWVTRPGRGVRVHESVTYTEVFFAGSNMFPTNEFVRWIQAAAAEGGPTRDAGSGVVSLDAEGLYRVCLLYTSPSPRDRQKSRMPSSA